MIGVLLVVLAIMGMTGRLGAGGGSSATGPDLGAPSQGSSTAQSAAGSGADSGAPSGSSATSGESDASPSSATPSENPDLKAPLTVLNGGGSTGLAGRARDAFVAKGWKVSEIGNYTGSKIAASTIYYPADDPDAQQAAKNLQSQFPDISKVEQTPSDLKFDGVVVILTGDWDPKSG